MTDATGLATRRTLRLLLLLPLLVVVAVLVNLKDIKSVVSGDRSVKNIVLGRRHDDASALLAGLPMPADTGAKDAKVTIEMFFRAGETCHNESRFTGMALAEMDPQRIAVKFRDTKKPDIKKRADGLKIGCEQGIAINGRTKFTLPGPSPENAMMGGPPGGPGAPGLPAKAQKLLKTNEHVAYLQGGEHWRMQDFFAALDQELRKAYDGEGLGMSQQQFADKVSKEAQRLNDAALAEAKARQKGAKSAPAAAAPGGR